MRIRRQRSAKIGWAFLAWGFAPGVARAVPPSVTCLGEAKAPQALVYMHGLEPVNGSDEERENQETLRAVAGKHGFRVAALKSRDTCRRGGQAFACWPAKTPTEAKATWEAALTAAKTCFPSRKDVGVVGFSNGGYLVQKVLQFCPLPGIAWLWSVGSGGRMNGDFAAKARECPRFLIQIGRDDITRKEAEAFLAGWRAAGGDGRLRLAPGGHRWEKDTAMGILSSGDLTAAEKTKR